MLNHAIILNGPPGVGKDTIASLLVQKIDGMRTHSFKEALYDATTKYFGLIDGNIQALCNNRSTKEQPHFRLKLGFMGEGTELLLSPRQALIFVSEHVIKPMHGNRYFGNIAKQYCRNYDLQNVVFPDGGFWAEIQELEEVYRRVSIVRLHRDGFDFRNDSRDYIDSPDAIDVFLEEDKPEQALQEIIQALELEIFA